MKFGLTPDFYKVLALFSEAGCPFTQAGSLVAQPQLARPLIASSPSASTNIASPSKEDLRSAVSTAGSDRTTLVPGLDSSIYSSNRPCTSSTSAWNSDSGNLAYSASAFATSRTLASSGDRHIAMSDSQSTGSMGSFHRAATSCGQGILQPTAVLLAARPSTAPTDESYRMSQMLPPKRELPFQKSRKTSGCSRKAPKLAQALSNGRTRASDGQATDKAALMAQVNQLPDDSSSAVPRKGASKGATKAIRVTKKSAAARSEKKLSLLEDDLPIPAVEDGLRRSQRLSGKRIGVNLSDDDTVKISISSIPRTVVASINYLDAEALPEAITPTESHPKQPEVRPPSYQHSNTENRALLDRPEERQQLSKAKRKDITGSHESSIHRPPSKRVATDTLLDQSDVLSGAHAEQFLNAGVSEAGKGGLGISNSGLGDRPSLPKMPNTEDVHGDEWQEHDRLSPAAHKCVKGPSAGSIDRGKPRHPERQPLADILNTAQPSRSRTVARTSMMALMNDEHFANSPEIAPWAGLPPEDRDAAIESWMCQQLEDESFATLTKILDGPWRRITSRWSDVDRNLAADDSR
jgi:hypothetical protein